MPARKPVFPELSPCRSFPSGPKELIRATAALRGRARYYCTNAHPCRVRAVEFLISPMAASFDNRDQIENPRAVPNLGGRGFILRIRGTPRSTMSRLILDF